MSSIDGNLENSVDEGKQNIAGHQILANYQTKIKCQESWKDQRSIAFSNLNFKPSIRLYVLSTSDSLENWYLCQRNIIIDIVHDTILEIISQSTL